MLLHDFDVARTPRAGIVLVCATRGVGGASLKVNLVARLHQQAGHAWDRIDVFSLTERENRLWTPVLPPPPTTKVHDDASGGAVARLLNEQHASVAAWEAARPQATAPTIAQAAQSLSPPLVALVAAYAQAPPPPRRLVVHEWCDDDPDFAVLERHLSACTGPLRDHTLHVIHAQCFGGVPTWLRRQADVLILCAERSDDVRRTIYRACFADAYACLAYFCAAMDSATADWGALVLERTTGVVSKWNPRPDVATTRQRLF